MILQQSNHELNCVRTILATLAIFSVFLFSKILSAISEVLETDEEPFSTGVVLDVSVLFSAPAVEDLLCCFGGVIFCLTEYFLGWRHGFTFSCLFKMFLFVPNPKITNGFSFNRNNTLLFIQSGQSCCNGHHCQAPCTVLPCYPSDCQCTCWFDLPTLAGLCLPQCPNRSLPEWAC